MFPGERTGLAHESPLPPVVQHANGRWVCSLNNGISVDLGTNFNPQEPTEYERGTLQALQTEKGVLELLDSRDSGARVKIGEIRRQPWYAWGGMTETETGDLVFHLGRAII